MLVFSIIIIYRKTDEFNKNHRIFGIGFIFKFKRIEIELTKEKITSNTLRNKAATPTYSYIHRYSGENLNPDTNRLVAQLSKNKTGIAIANFCV